ncbi:hypothetical protein CO174_03425 [Candidatus Uhrbacteria bacterium CG_4_9_14_3_um_filter_50_9]|uniref:Uncharacterized protein n=1 Tax=Candidatus Uhrbacteria bacterium CG_4_9_14_3_um_filter_50_9 TaxID=1975035 RepID=A0A2M7XC34_9BACT|nr:MAG: hypothetical protein CO174_03425 [Candidatus Uhrbacteria bacterium CG_4_9_14_3_um_filter_50_9]
MCFSATASFAASGVLAAAGATSWHTADKKERVLALIPIFFAAQQFIEGLQWVVNKPSSLSLTLGYAFLVFAFLIWPIYIPYVMERLENKKVRTRILHFLRWLGIFVAMFLLASVLINGLAIRVVDLHIVYDVSIPYTIAWIIAYVLATVGSLFVSSNRFFSWFGILSLVTVMISYIFFTAAFISVWCFFAAIMSALILVYLHIKPKHRWLRFIFKGF